MTSDWSEEKLKFLASTGHALAIGGPGSGKTHVALVKANSYIQSGRLKPGQKVLFLSFARPTIARLIEKAGALVGRAELRSLEINTYHAFAWEILKSHAYLLNGKPIREIQLMPPHEASAHLADIEKTLHGDEKERLFYEESRLHFDIFARLTARLLEGSQRLGRIYCDVYPLIILDEFQDTDPDQWAMIKQLGAGSRLIALGDINQRIYEFRGADPERLNEFIEQFQAELFSFEGENHRNDGTDITEFAKDLLGGTNKGKTYTHVKVSAYGFYQNRSSFYSLKTEVLQALRRLSNVDDHSVAVLVQSRAIMLQASEYLSSSVDRLPSLEHDVAMDAEPPALAAGVIAAILEGGSPAEIASRMLAGLHTHIRGRGGRKGTPQAELDLAGALGGFLTTGKIKGAKRQAIVTECQRIASHYATYKFDGNPETDWLTVRHLLMSSSAPSITKVAEDARFLRFMHRGSSLRASLGALWQSQGHYAGAERAVRDALLQEHFAATQTCIRGIHVMTMHKSKAKEFDEVIIFEGHHSGRLMGNPNEPKRVAQERQTLMVAATRAVRRTTILTPKRKPSPFLF